MNHDARLMGLCDAATAAYCNNDFQGGNWYLVRRVQPGNHWHPATFGANFCMQMPRAHLRAVTTSTARSHTAPTLTRWMRQQSTRRSLCSSADASHPCSRSTCSRRATCVTGSWPTATTLQGPSQALHTVTQHNRLRMLPALANPHTMWDGGLARSTLKTQVFPSKTGHFS